MFKHFPVPRTLIPCLVAAVLSAPAFAQSQPWLEKTEAIGVIETLPSGKLGKAELDRLIAVGGDLFAAKYTIVDGAGRPDATQASLPTKPRNRRKQSFARTSGPDSNGCSSCHHDPVTGGAGDFATNVFASAGFVNADFDTTDPQFSNERGTNHLFGAGLVELLAREMTVDLHGIRTKALADANAMGKPVRVTLTTKGVSFGFITAFADGLVALDEIEGIDTDLTVRPFSQKGVVTSLRQFTVNALNHHHGIQADERFGTRWTGTNDFDGDGVKTEIAGADISALVAWQASRPSPEQQVPSDPEWFKRATEGKKLFTAFGCDSCHLPALPLTSLSFADPGPLDSAGTLNSRMVEEPAIYDLGLFEWTRKLAKNDKGEVLVPLFGDLKRHVMTDQANGVLGNELLSQNFVDRNIFMTAELWGVGDTAPYGHRNDMTTMNEIILAHGGEAQASRDMYSGAPDAQRLAIVAFLKTLVIEP